MSDAMQTNENAVPTTNPSLVATDGGHQVARCDFRRSGKLTEDQAESVSSLHRQFAEEVSKSLTGYLRSEIIVSVESLQQIIFQDFLTENGEPEHLVPLSLNGFPQPALIYIGLHSACSLIELLLGGKVLGDAEKRALTEIDQHLLKAVLKIILRDLETTWQVPGITITAAEHALKPAAVQSALPENERLLSLTFSLNIGETKGQFVLLLPALFANTLIRARSADPAAQHHHEDTADHGVRERILECPFSLMAAIPNLKVTVRDLISMAPGTVLELHVPVKTPVSLMIEGEPRFEIAPVRSGVQRAAQVLRPVAKRWNK